MNYKINQYMDLVFVLINMQNKPNKYNLKNLFNELNLIKQELIQAENKIGWSTAFFAIIISILIAIGIQTKQWLIIGILMIFPISSLLVLVIALIPHIRLFPEKIINLEDRLNIMKINLFGYEKVYENTNIEKSLIDCINLFSKLAFRKYKLIKLAFLITFFWMIIFKALQQKT